MAKSKEDLPGPVAWLAYPLEVVYSNLAQVERPVEIVCELVTGGRVDPRTEAGLRLVRAVRVEGQGGKPGFYQLLVDRSPESLGCCRADRADIVAGRM